MCWGIDGFAWDGKEGDEISASQLLVCSYSSSVSVAAESMSVSVKEEIMMIEEDINDIIFVETIASEHHRIVEVPRFHVFVRNDECK